METNVTIVVPGSPGPEDFASPIDMPLGGSSAIFDFTQELMEANKDGLVKQEFLRDIVETYDAKINELEEYALKAVKLEFENSILRAQVAELTEKNEDFSTTCDALKYMQMRAEANNRAPSSEKDAHSSGVAARLMKKFDARSARRPSVEDSVTISSIELPPIEVPGADEGSMQTTDLLLDPLMYTSAEQIHNQAEIANTRITELVRKINDQKHFLKTAKEQLQHASRQQHTMQVALERADNSRHKLAADLDSERSARKAHQSAMLKELQTTKSAVMEAERRMRVETAAAKEDLAEEKEGHEHSRKLLRESQTAVSILEDRKAELEDQVHDLKNQLHIANTNAANASQRYRSLREAVGKRLADVAAEGVALPGALRRQSKRPADNSGALSRLDSELSEGSSSPSSARKKGGWDSSRRASGAVEVTLLQLGEKDLSQQFEDLLRLQRNMLIMVAGKSNPDVEKRISTEEAAITEIASLRGDVDKMLARLAPVLPPESQAKVQAMVGAEHRMARATAAVRPNLVSDAKAVVAAKDVERVPQLAQDPPSPMVPTASNPKQWSTGNDGPTAWTAGVAASATPHRAAGSTPVGHPHAQPSNPTPQGQHHHPQSTIQQAAPVAGPFAASGWGMPPPAPVAPDASRSTPLPLNFAGSASASASTSVSADATPQSRPIRARRNSSVSITLTPELAEQSHSAPPHMTTPEADSLSASRMDSSLSRSNEHDRRLSVSLSAAVAGDGHQTAGVHGHPTHFAASTAERTPDKQPSVEDSDVYSPSPLQRATTLPTNAFNKAKRVGHPTLAPAPDGKPRLSPKAERPTQLPALRTAVPGGVPSSGVDSLNGTVSVDTARGDEKVEPNKFTYLVDAVETLASHTNPMANEFVERMIVERRSNLVACKDMLQTVAAQLRKDTGKQYLPRDLSNVRLDIGTPFGLPRETSVPKTSSSPQRAAQPTGSSPVAGRISRGVTSRQSNRGQTPGPGSPQGRDGPSTRGSKRSPLPDLTLKASTAAASPPNKR